MSQQLSADERAQAVELYQAGLTITQVANRMRRSDYAVRCVLAAANVPRRARNQSTITAVERAEVVRLYTVERLSTYTIAARVGRAQSAVWRILVDAEVPRRAPGWPKDAATLRRVGVG